MAHRRWLLVAAVLFHPAAVVLLLLPFAFWILPPLTWLLAWLALPVVVFALLSFPFQWLLHAAMHGVYVWGVRQASQSTRNRNAWTAAGMWAGVAAASAYALVGPVVAAMALYHVLHGRPWLLLFALITGLAYYGFVARKLAEAVGQIRTKLRDRSAAV